MRVDVKRLVVLVVLLSSVVACGADPIAGSPTSGAGSVVPPSTRLPSSPNPARSLPYDAPCSLLSSNDLQQLGASTPASRDDLLTSHGCSFETANASIDIGVRVNVGLAGFRADGGTITSPTIGHHAAKQDQDRTGSCVIALGVTNTSRVDVTATANNEADACPIALQVARLVEPKLPVVG
jgi:hypothetical protein